jgi:hypothetical protein
MEKTRHGLADAAAAKTELLQAKRQQAAVHLDRINSEIERATEGYQHAWENGDAALRAIAALGEGEEPKSRPPWRARPRKTGAPIASS